MVKRIAWPNFSVAVAVLVTGIFVLFENNLSFAAELKPCSEAHNRGLVDESPCLITDPAILQEWNKRPFDDGLAAYNAGDHAKALRILRPFAERGDAKAQSLLGFIYASNKGVQRDYGEAIQWHERAARQGRKESYLPLAILYMEDGGFLRPANYREAARWLHRVVDDPSSSNVWRSYAQEQIGRMYAKGLGVPQDYVLAYMWLNLAATGLPAARFERDEIARLMTREQIADAQTLSSEWRPGNQEEHPQSIVSLGTGWPTTSGYVVTNHHVIDGRNSIILIRPDGARTRATVVIRDKANDLALLRTANPNTLPPALPLTNQKSGAGASVFTIGYPHPDVMGAKPKLTDGVISAASGLQDDPRTYQITVPLQAGNSGGPLLNMKGEVVGVVTSKLSAMKMFKWTGDLPQNVNYAVKVQYLKALLDSATLQDNRLVALPRNPGSLEELATRIQGSVMMVIAE